MSRSDAAREAGRAVNEAIRDSYAANQFKIVRFGRHREGYLHAQVTVSGLPVYVFRRWGSWQIPQTPQEPDCPVTFTTALQDVLAPYTYVLADESHRFEAAERKREEQLDDAVKAATVAGLDAAAGGPAAVEGAGVPEG